MSSSQTSDTRGKGKERAERPPEADVINLVDSDEDSDTEFFKAKPIRRTGKKKAPPPPRDPTPPPPPVHNVVSDSDSDSEAEQRRKRRRAKARPKPTLPEWTRQPARASVERGRSTTAGRESAEPVAQSSEAGTSGRTESKYRQRVELTPPPELPEEERARIKEQSMLLFQDVGLVDDEVVGVQQSSSPGPVDSGGASVQITVQMVVDPDRRATAPESAIRGYERKRVFHIFQNAPLSTLLLALADRVQKPAHELVLVHEGQRIFSTEKTPAQLGITFTGEMKGYEMAVYEKIQREERRARLALFDDSDVGTSSKPVDVDADSPRASPSRSQPVDGEPSASTSAPISPPLERPRALSPSEKVKLVLRGPKGEEWRFSVSKTTLVSSMLKYYCSKSGLDESEMVNLRLSFDGEHFDSTATVEDMELESGDLIDVEYRR